MKNLKISLAILLLFGTQTTIQPTIFDSIKHTYNEIGSICNLIFVIAMGLMIMRNLIGRDGGLGKGNSSYRVSKPKSSLEKDYGSRKLPEAVTSLIDQIKNPSDYKDLNAEISDGILLHGPPGTGKTSLARCIANEVDCPFFAATATDFIKKFQGQGPETIKYLFSEAAKAASTNENKCAIIFIDEIDVLGNRDNANVDGSNYNSLLIALFNEMDGFKNDKQSNIHIIVIAATNMKHNIDEALLSRFSEHIEVPLPDEDTREAIAEIYIDKYPKLVDSINAKNIARLTDGMAGRTIKMLFERAARRAASNKKKQIDLIDFAKVLIRMDLEKRNIATENEKKATIKSLGLDKFPYFSIEKFIKDTKDMTLDQFASIFRQAINCKENSEVTPNSFTKATALVRKEIKEDNFNKKLNIYSTLYPCPKNMNTQKLTKQFQNGTKRYMNKFFEQVYLSAKIEKENNKSLMQIQ